MGERCKGFYVYQLYSTLRNPTLNFEPQIDDVVINRTGISQRDLILWFWGKRRDGSMTAICCDLVRE